MTKYIGRHRPDTAPKTKYTAMLARMRCSPEIRKLDRKLAALEDSVWKTLQQPLNDNGGFTKESVLFTKQETR